ncbi:hypothetical protein P20652_1320 [Pseudoalteromonas sp. BSi20652]|nr:hypothetical protein P20652_1320 [Pseudoalteromonas sp. BSi20652]
MIARLLLETQKAKGQKTICIIDFYQKNYNLLAPLTTMQNNNFTISD